MEIKLLFLTIALMSNILAFMLYACKTSTDIQRLMKKVYDLEILKKVYESEIKQLFKNK